MQPVRQEPLDTPEPRELPEPRERQEPRELQETRERQETRGLQASVSGMLLLLLEATHQHQKELLS